MANKESEAVKDGESEGDTLSSLTVITEKSIKRNRDSSRRTYSTSEADREEKKSAKIVTEFLSRSSVVNNSVRHAPLHEAETPVQEMAELKLNTVCKKKMPGKGASSGAFYTPPMRHRPNDSSPTTRPRSRSVPVSDVKRSTVSN